MNPFLGEDWAAAAGALAPEGLPPCEARVQLVVTGGPARETAVWFVVRGGRLAEAGTGRLEDAEVVFTAAADDARALAQGQLDPSVAMMQGRLKVAGDFGRCLELLPRTRRAEWRSWRDALAARTAF